MSITKISTKARHRGFKLRCRALKSWINRLCFIISLAAFYEEKTRAQENNNALLNSPKELPRGLFPHVNTIQDNESNNNESLKDEVKILGVVVKDAVQNFASRRNFSCLKRPCLVQAFPLLYSKPNSGFFGGFRANIRDISREIPPEYVMNMFLVRSDSDQWLSFFALDFPKIDFLPLQPRLKLKTSYSKTTEIRYFGMGIDALNSLTRDDSQLRYGIEEIAFHSALIVPAFTLDKYHVSVFGSFDADQERPSRFSPISKLYEDSPLGIGGGHSGSMGLGLLIDSRDREEFSRHGWALEIAGAVSGNPLGDFSYQRFSLIDRRYFSWGKNTFAIRTTLDNIIGNAPFWTLEKVGGIDPIDNVGGSGILRGFTSGRFHEKTKLIESTEMRHFLTPRRFFGQFLEMIWLPLAIDLGRIGGVNVISATTGIDFLFNKSFLIQLSASRSDIGNSFSLGFDKEF